MNSLLICAECPQAVEGRVENTEASKALLMGFACFRERERACRAAHAVSHPVRQVHIIRVFRFHLPSFPAIPRFCDRSKAPCHGKRQSAEELDLLRGKVRVDQHCQSLRSFRGFEGQTADCCLQLSSA